MTPLTPDHLSSLRKGDKFLTEGIFLGLDAKEPLTWELTDGNAVAGEYLFKVRYFGVMLCEVCATIRGKKAKVHLEEV